MVSIHRVDVIILLGDLLRSDRDNVSATMDVIHGLCRIFAHETPVEHRALPTCIGSCDREAHVQRVASGNLRVGWHISGRSAKADEIEPTRPILVGKLEAEINLVGSGVIRGYVTLDPAMGDRLHDRFCRHNGGVGRCHRLDCRHITFGRGRHC